MSKKTLDDVQFDYGLLARVGGLSFDQVNRDHDVFGALVYSVELYDDTDLVPSGDGLAATPLLPLSD